LPEETSIQEFEDKIAGAYARLQKTKKITGKVR
jgi:hypothetical protein